MSVRAKTPPVAVQRLRQSQLGDDAARAHGDVSGAIQDLEKQVGALTSNKPTVTGSKGGNVALASLIAALASLGLVKDGTT